MPAPYVLPAIFGLASLLTCESECELLGRDCDCYLCRTCLQVVRGAMMRRVRVMRA